MNQLNHVLTLNYRPTPIQDDPPLWRARYVWVAIGVAVGLYLGLEVV